MKSAGILFSNQSLILLGRKTGGKLKGMWTGIGGMLERGERPEVGAVRETLEEIYGINNEPQLVRQVQRQFPSFNRVSQKYGFSLYTLNFRQLNRISRTIYEAGVSAPYFPVGLPTTVEGLVAEFTPNKYSEFTELGLLEIEGLINRPDVDRNILLDIYSVKASKF
jgi:hypothetical protein